MRLTRFFSLGLFMLLSIAVSGLYLQPSWQHYQAVKKTWQRAMKLKARQRISPVLKRTLLPPVKQSVEELAHQVNQTDLELSRLTILEKGFYRYEVSGNFSALMNHLAWANAASHLKQFTLQRASDRLCMLITLRLDSIGINAAKKAWHDPFHLQIASQFSRARWREFSIQDMRWVGWRGVNSIWELPDHTLQTAGIETRLGQESCQRYFMEFKKMTLLCSSSNRPVVKELS